MYPFTEVQLHVGMPPRPSDALAASSCPESRLAATKAPGTQRSVVPPVNAWVLQPGTLLVLISVCAAVQRTEHSRENAHRMSARRLRVFENAAAVVGHHHERIYMPRRTLQLGVFVVMLLFSFRL